MHRPEDGLGDKIVHGHTHAKTRLSEKRMHVGVDAWKYQLMRWSGWVETLPASPLG